jgi:hypothetical protein
MEIPHLSFNHQITSWILLGDEKLGSLYQIAAKVGKADRAKDCMRLYIRPAATFMLPANLPIRTGKARGKSGFSRRAGREAAALEVQRTSAGNGGEPSKRAISWG